MAEPVIRVVMVDDHEMVLHGVNAMLTHFTDDVVVVGTATTSADAFVEVTNERPDVLVCDIRLGKDSGLDLCQLVKAFDPDGRNRPPLEAAASARLFLRAARGAASPSQLTNRGHTRGGRRP